MEPRPRRAGYGSAAAESRPTAAANSSLKSATTVRAERMLSTSPTPCPTQYVTNSRAAGFPESAALSIAASAGELNICIKGIGKTSGLSALPQASCHFERSCRLGLPVRAFERIVSRDVASIIFSRNVALASDSGVASQTEPVHAPCAPIAMQAAICPPVMMPPAAITGTFLRVDSTARITSGMSTSVETSPQ